MLTELCTFVAELQQPDRSYLPPSASQELSAVAQETRINQLQSVIVSLQTELRQAERRAQQAQQEATAAKYAAAPQLRALAHVEEELLHNRCEGGSHAAVV